MGNQLRKGIYQGILKDERGVRLDYLLHIPIAQMAGDNAFYRRVVRDLRHGWWRAMKNPWLTKKNKCYHTLFAIAPKGIRVLHKKLKHIE